MGLLERIFKGVVSPPSIEPEGAKANLTPDGYPLVDFSPSIRSVLRMDGIGFNYAQIYASQQNVRTVIDYVARQGAGLRLKHYEKVSRASLPADRLELDESRLAILLDDPTPGQSRFDFYYAMIADLCIYDEWKCLLVRPTGTMQPQALVRVPPPNLIPERDPKSGEILYWYDLQHNKVKKEDVVWFNGYDPQTNSGAIPPMETLRRLMAEDYARDRAQEAFWRRGLRKDGVIEQDKDVRRMSDEALESFLVDAEDSLGGSANSYRPFVLQPGMKWVDITWNPNALQYIQARRVTRQEACSMFHVPPQLVAAAENGTQPDEAALRVFYQSSLPPYLERIEANIKAKLMPLFTLQPNVRRNQYVKFNLDERLRGAFEEKAAIMATTAGGPVVTVNEARARLDLPPTDNPLDNEVYQPMNSMRGGGPQVSPQNPTDTPASTERTVNPAGTTPGGGSNPKKSAADIVREFEERLKRERELVAKHARLEERGKHVIERHFERQQAVQKSYDDERWTRELTEDLTSAFLPFSLAVKNEKVQWLLWSFAQDVNIESEKHRDNGAFDPERAGTVSTKLADRLLEALDGGSMNQETAR